jgi:hypothetical protein
MDKFTQAYMEAALWSSTDNLTPDGGEPLDRNFNTSNIAPESVRKMEEDCRLFQEQNAALLDGYYDAGNDLEQAGHDFWLTRNGHGSGFWDSNAPDDVRKGLTNAAHTFGEQDIYVGDDQKLYVSGGEQDQKRLPLKAKLLTAAPAMPWPLVKKQVREVLSKGPKTGKEIDAALGIEPGSQAGYQIMRQLQEEGFVKQHKMRWHLVANIVRGLAITGARHPLQAWDWHALNLALQTMRMPAQMLGVMGGPSVTEARKTIKRITGKEYEDLPESMQRGHAPRSIPACMRKRIPKKAYDPGEEAYIYRAALVCKECGDKIKAQLAAEGKAPANPEDERSFDSDDYPKGPYADGGGESDVPESCDVCHKFLQNPLTQAGYRYLRELVQDHETSGRGSDEVIQEWKEFYPEAFDDEHGDESETGEVAPPTMENQASLKTARPPLEPQKDPHPWKDRLRRVYDNDFGQFEAYDSIYGIAKRLGFGSAQEAWEKNPVISGSVYPEDLRVVGSEEVVASAIKTAMTRKDYTLIADVLRNALLREKGPGADAVLMVAEELAMMLKRDNPRFDTEHFMSVLQGTKTLTSRPGHKKVEQPADVAGRPWKPATQASAPVVKRLAGGPPVDDEITPELLRQAQELIDRDDQIIYDVAADKGQIVGNVKHMSWFVHEVASWLRDDPEYYAAIVHGEGSVGLQHPG